MRSLCVSALLCGLFAVASAADPAPESLPPTRITLKQGDATLAEVARALAKASGLTIAVEPRLAAKKSPIDFNGTPLWEALEKTARDAGARIVVESGGRKITLAPRGEYIDVSSISGPFRVSVRSVVGRLLFDSGAPFHDILLDVHWEPRYHVFRIDSNPKIRAAKFEKSNDLITDPAVSRHHPVGASTEMTIRLAGLPRRAAKIDVLAGEFRATVAEKMLTFTFDDLTAAAPVAKTVDRVAAKVKPFTFDETTKTWDVDLELLYPSGGPVFESFEEHKWLRDNRLQLVSPQGKTTNPDSEDVTASGNKVFATYRFKDIANPKAKGWSLVYEAPGPLTEVTVPFKLENIPLP